MAVYVKGLRELQAALAKADKDIRLGVRKELRDVAEPVRRDAEALAGSSIRNIGERWDDMRVGVTRTMVYVAPRRKGVRAGNPRKRPNLARLLAARALEPALDRNQHNIRHDLDRVIDRVCDRFNRGH